MSEAEIPKQNVAGARLRLRAHVSIAWHVYRGVPWAVVSDEFNTTHFRCSAAVARFLKRLDGQRTVADAFALAAGGDAGEEDWQEALVVLQLLQQADMLQGDLALPARSVEQQRESARETRVLAAFTRPLAIRLPLFDPGRLLDRLAPVGHALFNRVFYFVAGITVLAGLLVVTTQWDGLASHFDARFADPVNLLSLWILYPVIKALHELGHGLACRKFGGEVREMGVMLLVLVPVPYVDASSSTAFPGKMERLTVAAAGILVEMLLAALAALAWVAAPDGLVRDLAFNILFIAGASSLLFNGNPLLRFDGYYVLCDALEIPGLAPRSRQYLGHLFRRSLFRLSEDSPPRVLADERGWLIVYGIASTVYRWLLAITIAVYIVGQFFVLGVLLAAWFVLFQVVVPAVRAVKGVFDVARAQDRVPSVLAVLTALVAVPLLALALVPVPSWTYAEGLVVVPEEAVVRTGAPGFFEFLQTDRLVRSETGTLVAALDNPELAARAVMAAAERDRLQIEYQRALVATVGSAAALRAQFEAVASRAADLDRQLNAMQLRLENGGVFVPVLSEDWLGRFAERGTVVGYLEHPAATVRVAVPGPALRDLDAETVRASPASNPGQVIVATVAGETPEATRTLPGPALGSAGGGVIAVDMRDTAGTLALSEVFLVDLLVPREAATWPVGLKVLVRFEGAANPALPRVYRWLLRWIGEVTPNP